MHRVRLSGYGRYLTFATHAVIWSLRTVVILSAFKAFLAHEGGRPWLVEPGQSLCQPVGREKSKSNRTWRCLLSIYQDNPFASKQMGGWHVSVR